MRKTALSLLIVLTLSFMQARMVSAITIGFAPGSATDSWDIILSSVQAGTTVAGYDIDVTFNPLSHLSATNPVTFSPLFGDQINDYTLPNQTTSDGGVDYYRNGIQMAVPAGTIDLFTQTLETNEGVLSGLQGGLGGNILLATLFFDSIGAGGPLLGFDWYPGQDVKAFDNSILYDGNPVPEPGTLLLLGSGLAALLTLRKRFNLRR